MKSLVVGLSTRTGKDATEAFEDVGHSDEARDILKGLYIGDFDGPSVRLRLPFPTLPNLFVPDV
jgi:cytochrome b involved in lipid metabolism